MQDFVGKTAVVTGGGSGIGRSLALAFARGGMNVAVADVDEAAAESVAAEARECGAKAIAQGCDVADRTDVGRFADAVYAAFGSTGVLCNNAGVVRFKRAQDMADADWDWVVSVDLLGVIHGIQAFLPRMLAEHAGGHIVNTASIAGLFAGATPGLASYTTAKYGVVGLSESLAIDLAAEDIGVSVLCPGGVRTQIGSSERNRPARFGGPAEGDMRLVAGIQSTGMDPDRVAALVLRGIRENQLYIMTHPETRAGVEARFKVISAAFDRLEAGTGGA